MSITENFLALEVPDQIGLLLAMAVIAATAGVWLVQAFIEYCERQPIYDPMTDGPVDPAEAEALADHLRGTKL